MSSSSSPCLTPPPALHRTVPTRTPIALRRESPSQCIDQRQLTTCFVSGRCILKRHQRGALRPIAASHTTAIIQIPIAQPHC
jgi:hypothetical protein